MKVSLVIATYNWEDALDLVLISVIQQSVQPNEILIADDGSTEQTKEVINSFSTKLNIKHIWHKDNGFQKTIILNKALSKSSSDYIIQIDGDIIMHKDFIKDHISNSKKGQFIHGSRAFLNEDVTREALKKKNLSFSFLQRGIKNRFNTINSNFLASIISKSNPNLKGTRGCNFSFWRDDFIAVNGYNEEMIGWGKEDTELSVRLINRGLIKLHLKFNAVCYHLHHDLVERKGININNSIVEKAITQKTTFCPNGINKYAKRDK